MLAGVLSYHTVPKGHGVCEHRAPTAWLEREPLVVWEQGQGAGLTSYRVGTTKPTLPHAQGSPKPLRWRVGAAPLQWPLHTALRTAGRPRSPSGAVSRAEDLFQGSQAPGFKPVHELLCPVEGLLLRHLGSGAWNRSWCPQQGPPSSGWGSWYQLAHPALVITLARTSPRSDTWRHHAWREGGPCPSLAGLVGRRVGSGIHPEEAAASCGHFPSQDRRGGWEGGRGHGI